MPLPEKIGYRHGLADPELLTDKTFSKNSIIFEFVEGAEFLVKENESEICYFIGIKSALKKLVERNYFEIRPFDEQSTDLEPYINHIIFYVEERNSDTFAINGQKPSSLIKNWSYVYTSDLKSHNKWILFFERTVSDLQKTR